jgi:hypothetical protein
MLRPWHALAVVAVLLPAACSGPDRGTPATSGFEADFATCTPGSTFSASLAPLDVRVRYAIIGAAGTDCRVSMTYESNPNPAWENQPLLLTLDPQQPFMPQVQEGIGSCMTGGDDRFDCDGPLLDVIRS